MAGNPLSDPNWASDLTETIVTTVDKVRDRTTKPIVVVARGLVYGLLTSFLAILVVGLLIVGLTRGVISFLEWPFDHDTAVWVSYFVVGAVFLVIGLGAMSKRRGEESV